MSAPGRDGGGGEGEPPSAGAGAPLPFAALGPYDLVRRIGEGGFAETFEARHRLLGEAACVKLARPGVDEDLLLREGRLLWGLHHPSLPTLRDALRAGDGRLALVLRYFPGETLAARAAAAPLGAIDAARILAALLPALRHLHRRGIVHGDVQPKNVILAPSGAEAALVDLGMAVRAPKARTRPLGFTARFVAPETERGAPPLPESDLYGLGASLLWALGADLDARRLPPGVPAPLLELLAGLAARPLKKRASWEARDPLARLAEIGPALGL